MRNGDYSPTRFEAQMDAVNLLFSAKTQSNPENTVGLVSMGGKTPQLLVTLTNQVGKVLAASHNVKLTGFSYERLTSTGSISLANGLQVAQVICLIVYISKSLF
jgi:26S proteasome regulatory subunit N10